MDFCHSVFKGYPLHGERIAEKSILLSDSRSLQMTIFLSWIECKFESWSEKSLHHMAHTYKKMVPVQMCLFGKVMRYHAMFIRLLWSMIIRKVPPQYMEKAIINKWTDSVLCACIAHSFVTVPKACMDDLSKQEGLFSSLFTEHTFSSD